LIKVYAAIDLYYDGEAFETAGFRKQTNSQEHQGTSSDYKLSDIEVSLTRYIPVLSGSLILEGTFCSRLPSLS
jgi:hypothetical protein